MSLGSYEKIQDVMVSLCLPYSDVVLLVLLHAVLFTLYLPSQHSATVWLRVQVYSCAKWRKVWPECGWLGNVRHRVTGMSCLWYMVLPPPPHTLQSHHTTR